MGLASACYNTPLGSLDYGPHEGRQQGDKGPEARPRRLASIRGFSFGPLGFVPLGFGSLNYGIWPSIRVFGTQNLGVQTLRVQT